MPAKRYVIAVNPRGGGGRGPAVLEQVRPVFEAASAELEIHVTTRPGQAAEVAGTADFGGCDGFCVLGGDGTVHEAVGGLLQRTDAPSVPLGVIPAGTGNAVAEHLGCHDPLVAARRIVAGRSEPLDVVRLAMADGTVEHCANIIGWGAAVDINRTAERLRKLGSTRYTAAAVLEILRARRRKLRLTLDDEILEDRFRMVVVCNTKFTGKGMQLAPHAEVGDGKLDVVFVRDASRWQMLKLLQSVFDGSHLSLPCVEYRQVTSFAIRPEQNDLLNFDGELKGQTPVSGEILPGALQIFA